MLGKTNGPGAIEMHRHILIFLQRFVGLANSRANGKLFLSFFREKRIADLHKVTKVERISGWHRDGIGSGMFCAVGRQEGALRFEFPLRFGRSVP